MPGRKKISRDSYALERVSPRARRVSMNQSASSGATQTSRGRLKKSVARGSGDSKRSKERKRSKRSSHPGRVDSHVSQSRVSFKTDSSQSLEAEGAQRQSPAPKLLVLTETELALRMKSTLSVQGVESEVGSGDNDSSWESNFRLSRDTIPIHYDVHIHPNFETKLFYGRVAIHLKLTRCKRRLWLHLKGLHVTSTQLYNDQGFTVELLSTCKYPRHEFWILFREKSLPPGTYLLKMDYNGRLRASSVGLVFDEYTDSCGNPRNAVFSLLEPVYARRVFPCFDEPSFKATFKVTLVHPTENYVALSNMPPELTVAGKPEKCLTTVTFFTTPPMSTYLLCFVICPRKMWTEVMTTPRGVCITACVGPAVEKEMSSKLANLAKESLNYFDEYFNRAYPLPKLDIISIKDLPPRAMENWGIILINESLLQRTRDLFDYESLAFTIGLQVASMWIGNLVSINWWDDIWLKEGLTIHQANNMCRARSAETQDIANFHLAHLHRALREDALRSSRKVLQNISHPREIACAYSSLSYAKVATLLGMFEQVHPAGFRLAVVDYIRKYEYRSTPAECFLCELSENQRFMDIGKALRMWVDQPGYPIILAARQRKVAAMAQVRCTADIRCNTNIITPDNDFLWDLPITFITSAQPRKPETVILAGGHREVRVCLPEGVRWFKVNFEQRGYYRVTYRQEEWVNLKNVLSHNPNEMTPEDRANLIDDSLSLARSGYLCYGVALNFISYFQCGRDTHWLPWAVLSRHVTFLKNALECSSKGVNNLKLYIRSIIEPSMRDDLWLQVDRRQIGERKFRVTALDLLCKTGNNEALCIARKLFKAWRCNHITPHLDIRRLVFKYGMDSEGNLAANWNYLWNVYTKEEDANERTMLLEVLSTVDDREILTNLLNKLKGEYTMSDHDFFLVLYEMSSFRKGNKVVWNFIKCNWEFLTQRFASCITCVWLLFPHMALLQQTEEELKEVQKYLKKIANPSAVHATDNILYNIAWNQRYRKIVTDWLEFMVCSTSSTSTVQQKCLCGVSVN